MKEKIEEGREDDVQGIEMIDLGDATKETRQGGIVPSFPDSCCTWTYSAE
jgi:hypothetical protein